MLRAVLLAVMATFLAAGAASAQSSLLQSGPNTPGHVPQYVGQGISQPVVQDGGGSGGGGLGSNPGEIGITARSPTNTYPSASSGHGPNGEHACVYDAPTNNPTGYHYLCFDSNAQGGGLIDYGSGGLASPLPFTFLYNGTQYSFPFAIGGIIGPSTTTVGDIAIWNNASGTLLKAITPGSGVAAALAQPVTGTGSIALAANPTFTGTVALPAGTAATNLGGGTAQTGILVGNGTSAATAISPGSGVATALTHGLNSQNGIAGYVLPPAMTINLLAYGVDVAGSTDACTTVIPAVLAALPVAGGVIVAPAGDIKLGSNCLAVTNQHLTIIGQGPGVTRFHCYSTSLDCMSFTATSAVYQATFESFSIYPETANTTGAAIHVNYSNSITPATGPKTASFINLEIGYANNANNYFNYGLNTNSCVNCILMNVTIHGANKLSGTGVPTSDMLAAIRETGHSIAFAKFGLAVALAQYGIYACGDVQGNQEFAPQFIGVNYGEYYDDGTCGDATSTPGDPGPELTNPNIAAYYGNLVFKGWNQVTLNQVNFYKRSDSTQNWIGVYFNQGTYGGTAYGSNQNQINGGFVNGFRTGGSGGTAEFVKFDQSSSGNLVTGVTISSVDNAVDFGGASGNSLNFVTNNNGYGFGTGWAVGLASSSCNNPIFWQNNNPVNLGATSSDAFLPTGSTPCILPGFTDGIAQAIQGQQNFLTNNSGAVSVTGFLTPYYGQTITVIGNDGGKTTIVDSSTMFLKGGVNVTLANGNSVTLNWNGTAWREMSRNF